MIQLAPFIKYISGTFGVIFLLAAMYSFTPEASTTGGTVALFMTVVFFSITYWIVKLERKLIAIKDFAVDTIGAHAGKVTNAVVAKLNK